MGRVENIHEVLRRTNRLRPRRCCRSKNFSPSVGVADVGLRDAASFEGGVERVVHQPVFTPARTLSCRSMTMNDQPHRGADGAARRHFRRATSVARQHASSIRSRPAVVDGLASVTATGRKGRCLPPISSPSGRRRRAPDSPARWCAGGNGTRHRCGRPFGRVGDFMCHQLVEAMLAVEQTPSANTSSSGADLDRVDLHLAADNRAPRIPGIVVRRGAPPRLRPTPAACAWRALRAGEVAVQGRDELVALRGAADRAGCAAPRAKHHVDRRVERRRRRSRAVGTHCAEQAPVCWSAARPHALRTAHRHGARCDHDLVLPQLVGGLQLGVSATTMKARCPRQATGAQVTLDAWQTMSPAPDGRWQEYPVERRAAAYQAGRAR